MGQRYQNVTPSSRRPCTQQCPMNVSRIATASSKFTPITRASYVDKPVRNLLPQQTDWCKHSGMEQKIWYVSHGICSCPQSCGFHISNRARSWSLKLHGIQMQLIFSVTFLFVLDLFFFICGSLFLFCFVLLLCFSVFSFCVACFSPPLLLCFLVSPPFLFTCLFYFSAWLFVCSLVFPFFPSHCKQASRNII